MRKIEKDICPYCKGKKYKGSKSCDECYRKGKFRGKLSYVDKKKYPVGLGGC